MDSAIQNIGDAAVAQANAPKLGGSLGANTNIDKAAGDFEGMFMTQMLQTHVRQCTGRFHIRRWSR